MTTDDILRMAREAGLLYASLGPTVDTRYMRKKRESVAAFARAIERAALERAAVIAEEEGRKWRKACESNLECACYDCAAAIRAAKEGE